MKMDTLPPNPDQQIEHIRELFEEINKIPQRQPRGIGRFFHNLAQRMSQPQKKIIMKRVLEAEPPKRNVIQH
jgi:hypothetical protein